MIECISFFNLYSDFSYHIYWGFSANVFLEVQLYGGSFVNVFLYTVALDSPLVAFEFGQRFSSIWRWCFEALLMRLLWAIMGPCLFCIYLTEHFL